MPSARQEKTRHSESTFYIQSKVSVIGRPRIGRIHKHTRLSLRIERDRTSGCVPSSLDNGLERAVLFHEPSNVLTTPADSAIPRKNEATDCREQGCDDANTTESSGNSTEL